MFNVWSSITINWHKRKALLKCCYRCHQYLGLFFNYLDYGNFIKKIWAGKGKKKPYTRCWILTRLTNSNITMFFIGRLLLNIKFGMQKYNYKEVFTSNRTKTGLFSCNFSQIVSYSDNFFFWPGWKLLTGSGIKKKKFDFRKIYAADL